MADTHDPVPDPEPSVDLTKRADRASPGTESSEAGSGDETIALPRTMQFAVGAIAAQLALGALYAILSWPLAHQLHDAVITSNHKLKKPKVLCGNPHVSGCLDVDNTVRAIQRSTLIVTVIIGALILILVPRIRRGNRTSRTVYIAVTVISAMIGFSASPLSLVALFSSGPVIPRVVAVIGALASILAIVALFMRESQAYFNAKSPNPLGPRPGLGSLLRPRPRPGAQSSTDRVPGMRTTPNRGENRPAARSKSRNDAEAIARGAALARSRAKANKSRRTDV